MNNVPQNAADGKIESKISLAPTAILIVISLMAFSYVMSPFFLTYLENTNPAMLEPVAPYLDTVLWPIQYLYLNFLFVKNFYDYGLEIINSI